MVLMTRYRSSPNRPEFDEVVSARRLTSPTCDVIRTAVHAEGPVSDIPVADLAEAVLFIGPLHSFDLISGDRVWSDVNNLIYNLDRYLSTHQ